MKNFIILAIRNTPEIINGEEYFETIEVSNGYQSKDDAELDVKEMASNWEGWSLVIEEEEF